MLCGSLTSAAGVDVRPGLGLSALRGRNTIKNSASTSSSLRVFSLGGSGSGTGTATAVVCSHSARGVSHAVLRHTATTLSRAFSSSSSSVSFPDDSHSSGDESTTKQESDDDDVSGGGLVGYPGRSRLSLVLDRYSRMSLPTETDEEMQKRPTSDIMWGSLMCFITFAVLGRMDAFIGATTGHPFMVGSWGTISVLAFGSLDAPVLRWGAQWGRQPRANRRITNHCRTNYKTTDASFVACGAYICNTSFSAKLRREPIGCRKYATLCDA